MAAITSENAAQAIAKLLAAQGLDVLAPEFVMGNLVDRTYEAQLAQPGDVINIPIPPVLQANNIAETGSVQTQSPSLGNAQVVLNTHAETTFQIPDVLKVLAHPELMNFYMQPAMVAIAERMETDLLSQYGRFSANAAVGTANTALTEAVIDSAETALFDARVPPSLNRNLIVASSAYSDLRKISRFTETQTIGDGSAIRTAKVGTLKGFDVYRSQVVPKVSTTTYNFAFVSKALALVTRRLAKPLMGTGAVVEYIENAHQSGFGMRLVMSYAPNTLAQQFTVDVLYGIGVLRNQFGVVVKS